jgi:hypothetical protein
VERPSDGHTERATCGTDLLDWIVDSRTTAANMEKASRCDEQKNAPNRRSGHAFDVVVFHVLAPHQHNAQRNESDRDHDASEAYTESKAIVEKFADDAGSTQPNRDSGQKSEEQ